MTWSFLFRLTKQIRWGGGVPTENADQFIAKAVPLTGTVQGVVRLKGLAGQPVVSGIPITLDRGRTATTGVDGMYTFDNVAEGPHDVALSAAELPADYEPGPTHEARVLVQPRRMVRTDFEVLPLVAMEGKVAGPEGAIGRHPDSPAARFALYNYGERGPVRLLQRAGRRL